jgi:O-antigen/teichoic acid export membrane protein
MQLGLLCTGIIVARALGPEDRGHLAVLILTPVVLFFVGSLGMSTALTYLLAQRANDRAIPIEHFFSRTALQVIALVTVHAGFVAYLAHANPGPYAVAGWLTLPMIPALFALEYGLATLQGLQQIRRFNALRLALVVVFAITLAAAVSIGRPELATVTATNVSAYVLVGLVTAASALRLLDFDSADPTDALPFGSALRFGLKSLLGATSPIEIMRTDQVIVALFLSPAQLGLYVVGTTLTGLPRLIGINIGMVAFPSVAREPDESARRRAVLRYLAVAIVLSGAIILVLEVTAGWLIKLFFGEPFGPATHTAQLLLVATLFTTGRRVLADGIRGAGHPLAGSLAEVSALVLLVGLAAWLAPLSGVEGVALALALASLAAMAALLMYALWWPGRDVAPATGRQEGAS